MSYPPETLRHLLLSIAIGSALVFIMACGSNYPALLSSTPDQVSVEFEEDASVATTRELAEQNCATHEKVAQFESLNETKSARIATYRCVPRQGQIAADAVTEAEAARLEREAATEASTEAARVAAEATAAAQTAQEAAETPAVSAAGPAEDTTESAGEVEGSASD
jgi:hypothetical protein